MDMDAALIKDGIKSKYGFRVSMFGRLVPKPSHLCDKFEEMSALIEGCFREAGDQGLDMREWILRWEQIKKERANAREKTSIQERRNDTERNASRGNPQ
jgi:hypothetical protein